MKIALAQINPRVGDILENLGQIECFVAECEREKTALLVFPELGIVGYPPRDLVFSKELLRIQDEAVSHLHQKLVSTVVILGCVGRYAGKAGRGLSNQAVILRPHMPMQIYAKRLLPTYDVFDEARYFQPGNVPLTLELEGKRIGLTICEDIWDPEMKTYFQDPVGDCKKACLDLLINISCSPFSVERSRERIALLSEVASRVNCPVAYCNQVGANEELIFDGGSQVVDERGQIVALAPVFEEKLLKFELGKPGETVVWPKTECSWILGALTLGVRDFVKKCRSQRVLLGLSGGIDSAVVAALAVKALGESAVTAVLMPSHFTSFESIQDAKAIAKALRISLKEISIQEVHEKMRLGLVSVLKEDLSCVAEENLQPRLRMVVLMAIANQTQALVLNTSNKSEIATGYSTQYGDAAGALSVIGDLVKHEVYELGRALNAWRSCIPERVFARAPTAELKLNQTDQDRLPPYPILDAMVRAVIEHGRDFSELSEFDQKWVQMFQELYRGSEFKRRQFPPVLRVSRKAFGMGRRIPLASEIMPRGHL